MDKRVVVDELMHMHVMYTVWVGMCPELAIL